MGQHRRVIQRIYQPLVKNSQSAFHQKPLDASQTQGSGLVMSSLWDGSENNQKLASQTQAAFGLGLGVASIPLSVAGGVGGMLEATSSFEKYSAGASLLSGGASLLSSSATMYRSSSDQTIQGNRRFANNLDIAASLVGIASVGANARGSYSSQINSKGIDFTKLTSQQQSTISNESIGIMGSAFESGSGLYEGISSQLQERAGATLGSGNQKLNSVPDSLTPQ